MKIPWADLLLALLLIAVGLVVIANSNFNGMTIIILGVVALLVSIARLIGR